MTHTPVAEPSFLAGGGEMGALIRQHHWAASPLGPPEAWPQALKVTVRLLLSCGHPMAIWWGPGLIQLYNDAYSRSIGPERHPRALGQPGRDCWQEIWPIIGPQIEQVMSGRGHTWNENHLMPITRHGKKEDVYWTYSYSPIDDPESEHGVGGVLMVCTETTEQISVQHQWQAAEARWRRLFDHAPVFMCALAGADHRFEYANLEYIKMVGRREIIGKPVAIALPEVAEQWFLKLLDNVYQTGTSHRGEAKALDLVQKEAGEPTRLFVDYIFQPIVDKRNDVQGIFVAGYDVTEHVLANTTLQDHSRRKDEFLAMLAHELRNPLAPIMNLGEWLAKHNRDAPAVSQAGDIIVRQCTQLTHLVDDLLDVSRITRATIELDKAPVNIHHTVQMAIEAAQPLIKEKHHRLEVLNQAGDEVFVNADMSRLVQCISNLLTNAIKYTPAEGDIKILVAADTTNASVTISDNGVGIAPGVLSSVFELFSQAATTIDRSHGGLGIGLSVVRQLIHMHGGTINATSAGLNKGSQFTISLPLIEPPAHSNTAPTERICRKARILIVDDNVDAAQSLSQLLSFNEHNTVAVHTPSEAIDQLTRFTPEVALLDIGLPELDGYQLARMFRTHSSATRLIALTGYGSAEDQKRASEAGFDFHLTKPVRLDQLEQVIQQCIGE